MKGIGTLLASAAILGLIGCGLRKPIVTYEMIGGVPANWNLTAEDAVGFATAYCERSGIDHVRQGPPVIMSDSYKGKHVWCIGYHRNSLFPGDDFLLLIDDDTRVVEYEGGE